MSCADSGMTPFTQVVIDVLHTVVNDVVHMIMRADNLDCSHDPAGIQTEPDLVCPKARDAAKSHISRVPGKSPMVSYQAKRLIGYFHLRVYLPAYKFRHKHQIGGRLPSP